MRNVQCREPKKGQEKVLILKKTTGLCLSRSYYSITVYTVPVCSLISHEAEKDFFFGEGGSPYYRRGHHWCFLIKCGEHLQRWARTSFRDALSPFALFEKVRAHIFDPRKCPTSGVKYPFVSGVFLDMWRNLGYILLVTISLLKYK